MFSDYFYQCGQVRKMTEDVLAIRMGRQARHQEEACQQEMGEEVLISKRHIIKSCLFGVRVCSTLVGLVEIIIFYHKGVLYRMVTLD